METRQRQKIQAAVQLVNEKAREAVAAAPANRLEAYRLLKSWSDRDAILEDALASVGLLVTLREQLKKNGDAQRALSIDDLLSMELNADIWPEE